MVYSTAFKLSQIRLVYISLQMLLFASAQSVAISSSIEETLQSIHLISRDTLCKPSPSRIFFKAPKMINVIFEVTIAYCPCSCSRHIGNIVCCHLRHALPQSFWHISLLSFYLPCRRDNLVLHKLF